jgi:hypothetical protein
MDLDGVSPLGEAKVILPPVSFFDDLEEELMCFSMGERRATLWLGDFDFAADMGGSDISNVAPRCGGIHDTNQCASMTRSRRVPRRFEASFNRSCDVELI